MLVKETFLMLVLFYLCQILYASNVYNYTHNFNQNYKLPSTYERHQFPSDIVEVYLGYYYVMLKFVDPLTNSFGLKHIVHLKWRDERLAWNSSRLEMAIIRSDQVWTPPVELTQNSVDSNYDSVGSGPNLRVFSKGSHLFPVRTFKCKIKPW